MSDAKCVYCGGDATARFSVGDLNRRVSTEKFQYCRCNSCGLLFLKAPPADLWRYYPSDYYHIPRDAQELAACAEPERYKIDIVQQFAHKGGSLIEIGPSSGCFCFHAKQAGFRVSAIEMNGSCCRFLREVMGVEAVQATDEVAALRKATAVDVIALWQVVEHLRAPWELIRAAAEKLNPGGILVISAPNPNALQFRLLGKRWVHVDAPRHVTLPSSQFIGAVAEKCGMRAIWTTTRDHGSLGWNEFGWSLFLANLAAGKVTKRIAYRIGRLVSWAMSPFESAEGAGCAYTIVLKKVEA